MEASTTNGWARRLVVRALAVLAVVAAAVALLMVVTSSLESDGAEQSPEQRPQQGQQRDRDRDRDPQADTYVVQPNETLTGIAEQVGIPVERLQRLNPEIDPQALPSGAVLKLRP